MTFIELAGIKIDDVTMDEAIARLNGFIMERSPHLIVTPNPEIIVSAQVDEELRNILNNSHLRLPDGISMVVVSRILMRPLRERVSGVDFMQKAMALASAKGYRVYLLGGAKGVANEAARKLRLQYPELQIVGARDGYFSKVEETSVVSGIRGVYPDILFAGLGMIRQEKWLANNLNELNVPACVGVGGSMDVISGTKQRAPAWIQALYIEWLYRLIMEPWRIKRQAALPKFLWLTLIKHGIMRTEWLKKLF